MPRLLAWNIRAGGGARLDGIAAAIGRQAADVLVLSECHPGAAGARLRAALGGLGYTHLSAAEPPAGRKGVLIAARRPFRDHGPVAPGLDQPHRLLAAGIGRLHVVGVHMPNLRAKVPYWEALLAHLAPRRGRATIALGDFNTCRHFLDEAGRFDRTAHFMDRIAAIGFVDAWRRRHPDRREFTWFSHRGNGFRIDHAFLSPGLARRAGAIAYLHAERARGLSDHSPLLVEVDV